MAAAWTIGRRALLLNVLTAIGVGLFMVVYGVRGPDDFPAAFFVSGPLLAAIYVYDRAKKDGSAEPGRLAAAAAAKVIGLVFLGWVAVVELHPLLGDVDVLHDAEPVLMVVAIILVASSSLVAAPNRRVRLRIVMFFLIIALIGLAAVAVATPGLGLNVTLVLAALAGAAAVGGYLLARRDPDLP